MLKIISNGSKFYGEQPDTIEKLLEVLKTETLDPMYEQYGNFVNHNPKWLRKDIQEKYNGCTQIHGNFMTISHSFDVITDEPETIEALTNAIRNNQKSTEYQQYRKEYFEVEQRKEEARKLFNTGKITLREMYARF